MANKNQKGTPWAVLLGVAAVISFLQVGSGSFGGWGIAFTASAVICIWLAIRVSRLGANQTALDVENRRLEQELLEGKDANERLAKRIGRLERYQAIVDVESHIAKLDADAKSERTELLANATERLKAADGKLMSAAVEGGRIIEDAKRRAAEIAGEAWSAKERADDYRRTAEAMRNAIEGYGDAYLVPTYTLLDELAEEFGHTEAGDNLKKAREC